MPPEHRTLTISDLPRNWNGQRKLWFAEALGLREQLRGGAYLDARQRMRIQESLFGQGEGLFVQDNYATDVELERAGWPEGAERQLVVAARQAAFARRVCRHSVSDLVRAARERHLTDVLYEREQQRMLDESDDDDDGGYGDGHTGDGGGVSEDDGFDGFDDGFEADSS